MGQQNRLRLFAAVSLVVVATALALSAAPAGAADVQVTHGVRATHGAGARMVDDQGRTVILRGVNVNGIGEYYQEWADLPATLPLGDADFARMAAHGINVVRLLITWSSLEPQPGQISSAYIDRIAATVAQAKKHDIYVLLDMHQDAWSPYVDTPDGVTCPPGLSPAIGWDGAPEWATALVGSPLTCTIGGTRELSVATQTSFSRFYLNIGGVQDHLVNVWKAVARRFANEPAVVGYDLLNEPNPGMVPGVDDYVLLGLFYGRAITAIRSVDTAHAIFFEPAVITGPLPTPGPIVISSADTNVVYAPHLYNESISILPGSIEDGFANAATAGATYGAPVFSGEWGWFGNHAADQPLIERYARNEDARMIGGTWWQWQQACGDPHAIGGRHNRPPCAGKSMYSDGFVTRSAANIEVLTRAYPRAAPGTLTSINATVATGALAITGASDRAGAAADLWIPARCATPTVTGTNVGSSTITKVDGGHRVTAVVAAPGEYRVTVACLAAATSPVTAADGLIPATGRDSVPALLLGSVAVALLVAKRARHLH